MDTHMFSRTRLYRHLLNTDTHVYSETPVYRHPLNTDTHIYSGTPLYRHVGPAVRGLINASPRVKFNPGFFFYC